MRRHGCACGAEFAGLRELIGHGLEVFPARADRPLDGVYHAPRNDGSDEAYQRAAECRKVHEAATRLLGFRQYLTDVLVADLDDLTVEMAARFDGWEYVSWAFDIRRHQRAAAHVACDISTGDLPPRQRVTVRAVMGRCHVSSTIAAKAITKLTEFGLLSLDGDGRGTARVACHTGASRRGGRRAARLALKAC